MPDYWFLQRIIEIQILKGTRGSRIRIPRNAKLFLSRKWWKKTKNMCSVHLSARRERYFIRFSPSYRRRTLNQEVLCSWYLILRVKYVYLTGACSFKAVLKSVQTRKSVWWTLRKAFYTIFSVLSETDVKPGGPVFMIFNYTVKYVYLPENQFTHASRIKTFTVVVIWNIW